MITAMPCAQTLSHQYLLAELARIDLLIRAHLTQARLGQTTAVDLQGLYIAEAEIDAWLAQPIGAPRWGEANPLEIPEVRAHYDQLTAHCTRLRAAGQEQGVNLRWLALERLFALTPLDQEILLLALAPELDLRYERLYAYLHDDVTQKRPTVDLVLHLLCPSLAEKWTARQRLRHSAPLIQHRLVQLLDDPAQPHAPQLRQGLRVEPRLVQYLLEQDEVDTALTPYVRCLPVTGRLTELLLPPTHQARLNQMVQEQRQAPTDRLLYFQGPYGVGKASTATALCAEVGLHLLLVDGERLAQESTATFAQLLVLLLREARLQGAALYWQHFDTLLAADKSPQRALLLQVLAAQPGLHFLSGDTAWEPTNQRSEHSFVRLVFPLPAYGERCQLWQRALSRYNVLLAAQEVATLAGKFRLSGGQIADAVATVRSLAAGRCATAAQVTLTDLYAACQLQAQQALGALAQKVTAPYSWTDLVLPTERLAQLRELSNAVKYRAQVYDTWGFDHKLALGKGINALFAGPSGTGKTMAAAVIANELHLELYQIDLATVVSKYIGETEKNLARIFAAAEQSNAILFFDEADALFGKRSEVRDAHDRYANIETGYLLQRMEAYAGVVILATNFRKNLDDAFVRRLHFTIDFPLPGEPERRRIWQQIWPVQTPRHPALDFDLLAQRFELAGGHIRNIALAAAFLAADNGQVVEMSHLLQATRRELQKMGKVVSEALFDF